MFMRSRLLRVGVPVFILCVVLIGLAPVSYTHLHARRVLLPFFAFVRMRVAAGQQKTSVWSKDLEAHQRIIDLIREGEGDIARQYVNRAMERFAKTAHEHWEKRGNAGR